MKQLLEKTIKTKGIMDDYVWFVNNHQLKDKKAWQDYIDVFVSRVDAKDEKWRGEYFGKQMRGACYTYAYTQDEELYDILTWVCVSILKTQDELGRISTYTTEKEFCGWDMWCRKYVLTGLQHYYRICKDNKLKAEILEACCKHLDYIVDKIGPNKIEITTTSCWWGSVNSCTILEPTIELYKMTKNQKYLEFAKYIISTGGSSNCNFIELVLHSELLPYQYPVTKAYEIMSFFEGLVAYYEVTEEKIYLDVVCKFMEMVWESDMTIIGCAGCTHELFDNSALRQTQYSERIMQETCVTVTWIRVLARLYFLSKDVKYIDRIEKSGFNALYGSVNTKHCELFEMFSNKICEAKVFDSYSPLFMNSRGRGIGGYQEFPNGGYGGCCISIGACGIALMPLLSVVSDDKTVYINYPISGSTEVVDVDGNKVTLVFESNYPTKSICKIIVLCNRNCNLNLKIRKPNWCDGMKVNGNIVQCEEYYEISGGFQEAEEIVFEWLSALKVHELNDKIAFTYGALTLAVDSAKSDRNIEAPVQLLEQLEYHVLEPKKGELVRIECETENGKLLLTDYQSCGKEWTKDNNKISVWLNTKEDIKG